MRSPLYNGDFQGVPFPDRYAAITFEPEMVEHVKLTAGIKTVIADRRGLLLVKPMKAVVVEMTSGDINLSFDLTPGFAKALALKLEEFAKAIEGDD